MTNNIGLIGVGKLGLPYALSFEKAGFTVYASSYKQDYVEDLQQHIVDTEEPDVKQLLEQSKNIVFTIDNHLVIENCDVIYIMVATPSLPNGEYDVDAVRQVARDFLSFSGDVSGKKMIIGSTVNPGDTKDIQDLLEGTGVNVVYSPTFVAQGRVIHDIYNLPGLLIGTPDKKVAEECLDIFKTITSPKTPISIVNQTTAEILKLALNCYTTVKISYFNKIGEILGTLGLDEDIPLADRALQNLDNSLANVHFGFGYGGPCLPRDNVSFMRFAEKIGVDYSIGEVIDHYNDQHNNFLFNWFIKKNTENKPFYFSHITYKKGTHITEQSRQFELCCKLLDAGYQVYIEQDKFLPPEFIKKLNNMYPNSYKLVEKDKSPELDFFEIIF